jgi:myo-inositol-1(or 4)-monophosphatase
MEQEYWLKQCREVGKKVFTEIKKNLNIESRRKILKMGVGGDKTSFLDDLAEKIILNHFKSTGKSFIFVSEEMGEEDIGDNPEIMIVVDPLDGSKNTFFGIPIYSTSISIGDISRKVKGVKVGYVKNLVNGDDYYAIKGKGVFKNKEKINVSKERHNFYLMDIASKNRRENFEKIVELGTKSKAIRMLGSGCLGLCYFAEGKSDAYIGLGGKRTLDLTSGQLIIREAGGIVKDLEGKNMTEYEIGFDMDLNFIAAANEEIYSEIVSMLR